MTWGDFKRWAEEQGVKDETPLWYIDFSFTAERLMWDDTGIYIE